MNPTPNWIDRVELVHLGFGLYELRIGSRVLGNYPTSGAACGAYRVLAVSFAARNGGAL